MKVLVVDDEPIARRRLIRMLRRIGGVEVAGEAANGEEALQRLEELRPDAVLLDIRMPGLDGLELVRRAAHLPAVIFTTAYEEHAVEAFETEAVDYLLKPVRLERLQRALAKVERRRAASNPERLAALLEKILRREEGMGVPRVTARSGKTIRVFDAREIARFRAADRYTVFRRAGEEFVLDESLNALEARLATHGFLRVHRSELVNLSRVAALHLEEGDAQLRLTDGQSVPVSRRLAPELKRRLGIAENP